MRTYYVHVNFVRFWVHKRDRGSSVGLLNKFGHKHPTTLPT